MSTPDYGGAPGFGGGYDEPPLGEFQPGDETGVVDPNAGRYGGRIDGFLSRTAGISPMAAGRAYIDDFKLLPTLGG